MQKAKNVIRPIRHLGNWCLQVWDGVSGKDHRRVKQLRHELALAQENTANLTRQLAQAQAQCRDLQGVVNAQKTTLNDRQRELADCQQTLEDSLQEYSELWQELDEWVSESDSKIKSLKEELRNRTSALVNCEANFSAVQQFNLETIEAISTAQKPEEVTLSTTLENWKIAFVGGHAATRRVVIQTLHEDHGLVYAPVEIPPSREVSSSQKQLKQKLAECDLIILIVRYCNHSLTKSLMQLKDKGALKGEILTPNSRGVSGVVRDILTFVAEHSAIEVEQIG
ncbi:hypothetical protein N836_28385 [Leptolyngbya sp. Heron Island J]|uniref:hypothetical protein n=1 Tax=Leptolyngbya sp. Heron Island J TaxID=1385935 RepID=UPI0003B97966|nr:hypothetical protein [Leptolyngbya sp. Heron Island J]ESA32076.1 hypothetical protein N836_28385 [Leptolyngbya sp. Heron Island J]